MIVFFDGACGLCDRAVRWAWMRTEPWVKFAPLQGATAQKLVPESLRTPPLQTLVIWDHGNVHVEMEGLHVLTKGMSRGWKTVGRWATAPVLWPLTNLLYRGVVRHRMWWFGTDCAVAEDGQRLLP